MRFLLLFTVFLFQFSVTGQVRSSHYVLASDSTPLAVDVYLPEGYESEKLPVLIQFERYWRSSISRNGKDTSQLQGRDKFFSDNGYIIIIVDTRGTGASFGTRKSEYSPIQVMDANAILDWVIAQPWSNGKVGAYGTSYTGTTAELLCATQHPSVKAVIPGWSDFDLYRSPARPYGLTASSFIKKWGQYVKLLDRNRSLLLRSSINPVNEDSLKLALKQHRKNVDVYDLIRDSEYRDTGKNGFTYEDCSVVHWQKEIEASGVPMLVFASWMDAGTAEGTIQRLENFSNKQNVLLMSTAHGGWCNASPFVVGDSLLYPMPLVEKQNELHLDFFNYHLKEMDNGVDQWPLIWYFNMGEEAYKTSDVWPIPGTTETRFYFHLEHQLKPELPENTTAANTYTVDFGVYTSKNNRWTTQMEGPVTQLNHRNEMDARMLVYTSAPAEEDIQITGTPTVSLHLTSTHEDGAVLVYLEDVDPDGNSTYITEGGLQLKHRKMLPENERQFNLHSFSESDASPMPVGEMQEITFKLFPTSVRIKKGHSIRIAIAGADKATFDRTPKHGTPTYTFECNGENPSFVTLPVIQAQ